MARVVVVQLWMVTILTDSSAADAATTLQALCSPGCSVTLGQQAVGRAMAEVAEEVPTPLSPPPPPLPQPSSQSHTHKPPTTSTTIGIASFFSTVTSS